MGAGILGKVPDADVSRSVAADNLALIRVYHDVVDRAAVGVAPLDISRACLPDFDSAILRARDHPLALTVERHACNVARVALKRQ